MNIVTTLSEWQQIRNQLPSLSIGFVPTMGHLHAGHLSLCQQSAKENAITVVSIFVNPTQFNDANDFARYPRTQEEDIALLSTCAVDYVFIPDPASLYPDQYEVQVTETSLSTELEGACRPHHFTGVLTIVLKLLNLIRPSRAYFGEKDYQQLLLIKKMVTALFLPVDIIACPTVRAVDQLALSSRNTRLSVSQRMQAVRFPQLLQSEASTTDIFEQLEKSGFKVDYIVEKWQRRLGAVWLDDVRLIDNVPQKNATETSSSE